MMGAKFCKLLVSCAVVGEPSGEIRRRRSRATGNENGDGNTNDDGDENIWDGGGGREGEKVEKIGEME